MSDLRYAVRSLRNNPGFTLVTALLLALGIGASCVIFSALDALLFRRLPVRQPDQLVRLTQNLPNLGKRSDLPYEVYTALRERSTVLSDVFGHMEADVALTDPGPAERIRVHLVTDNYFAALGVQALYGRLPAPEDAQSAVLTYGFWQRRFAGDPKVIGRTILLLRHRFTIVGVLPKAFNGFSIDTAPDVRLPYGAAPLIVEDTRFASLELAARLQPGVSAAQAIGETNAIWRAAVAPLYAGGEWKMPASQIEWQLSKGLQLDPLAHGVSPLRERFSGALVFLAGAVGLLLAMVCANVAGLLLARSSARHQEITVRAALGATRGRLVRQMLTESALIAALGGVGGLVFAYLSAPLLVRALPPIRDATTTALPLALHIEPNLRILGFSVVLCVLTVLLFGLAPAIQASRWDLHSSLRAARTSGAWRGRQTLVILEVALCTLLLAGAGLLVRTFEQLHALDAGVDRDHVVTLTTDPRILGYTPQQALLLRDRLLERVRSLPGVRSAAFAAIGLMHGSGIKMTVAPAGQRTTPADFLNASLQVVSPDYFETMGMHLIEGRGFHQADEAKTSPRAPVIVNQAFARRFFPGEDPVGRVFGSGSVGDVMKDKNEIVGVVSDAKYRSMREQIPPTVYQPYAVDARGVPRFILHVRTSTRPESAIGPISRALRDLDPQLPIIEVRTLAEEVDSSLWSERLTAGLASIFGALAAMLAAVGIYGLLAYAVSQRTREIGIRMALGAKPQDILTMIGRQAFAMVAIGIAIGLTASLAAAPAVRSLLYGIAPNDTTALSAAAVFVALIALAAAAFPVLHAIRVEPSVALRQEN